MGLTVYPILWCVLCWAVYSAGQGGDLQKILGQGGDLHQILDVWVVAGYVVGCTCASEAPAAELFDR